MFNAFDILKKLPDGGIVWIEAVKDLETARERIIVRDLQARRVHSVLPGNAVRNCYAVGFVFAPGRGRRAP